MNQTTTARRLSHAPRLRDQLGNADLTRTSTATFGIVDTLQSRPGLLAGEYLGAITAAFILTVEESGLSACDVLGLTRNMMADANGRRPEFKAAADYIKQEVF